ncbi:MAG TPA: hypothetical protein PK691_01920, partial [Thermomicrobiales bacterium]|nr:hypothetical protein [Thermomicrobiales bacterium]
MSTPPLDAIGTEYLTLALEIERLFPGFVDAYMGPPELKTRANGGPLPDPAALLDRARRLLTSVRMAGYSPNRTEFLRGQLTGIITSCRKLAGEEIAYVDEVQQSFDIVVTDTPNEHFDAAIHELDGVLPGQGSVRDRQIAWKQQFVIDQKTAAVL